MPALLMSLISLSLIKLFLNTATEYLRDLIPKLIVFIWGMKMPPFEHIMGDMRIYVTAGEWWCGSCWLSSVLL